MGARVLIGARCPGLAAVAAALILSWAFPASAQTALEDSVAKRSRPDYDPIGIVVGPADSFLFFPKLELAAEHTDNLFSEETNASSDQAAIFKPSFSLRSDWDNHAVGLSGKATYTTYRLNPDENSIDYDLALNGRLDVLERSRVTADATLRRGHEDRSSPDDPDLPEPSIVHVAALRASGLYNVDVIRLQLNVKAERSEFRDFINEDRDRFEIETRGRVGYEWVPGSTAFVEAAFNIREFDEEVDDFGFNRSSHGYEVLVGNTLDLTGVTFAELGVGYRKQVFDKQLGSPIIGCTIGASTLCPTLEPVEGFSFSGRLVWNPTDLLTITGRLRREVRETTIFEVQPDDVSLKGASTAFTSAFNLKADYELLENLIIDAEADFQNQDFDGIARIDNLLKLGLGARYLLGPNLFATAKYQFEHRDSNTPENSFTVNKFMVAIGTQF